MQFAKQFWKIIGWSFLSAWLAANVLFTVISLFEGYWLSIKPDQFPAGSEAMAKMDLATSALASMIAFWAFVAVLGIGILFGIILTCYEWVRYKKFPLLPVDRVDILRADMDKRLTEIEQDISSLKKKPRARRGRKPKHGNKKR